MSELKFNRVNNEQYNTVSVNIENAIIDIEFEDYYTLKTEKTKFGYIKSAIEITNNEIKNKLKIWEEQINEYLKNEIGTGPITILYINKVYPKLSTLIGQNRREQHISIRSVWINEKNKPFAQLWHVNIDY